MDGGTAVERNFPTGAIKSKFNKHIRACICNYEFKASCYLFLSKRTVSSIGYISFIIVVIYAYLFPYLFPLWLYFQIKKIYIFV